LADGVSGEPAGVVIVQAPVSYEFQAGDGIGAVAPLGAEVGIGFDCVAACALGADAALAAGEVVDPVVDRAFVSNRRMIWPNPMRKGVALCVGCARLCTPAAIDGQVWDRSR
jgi:hypothetical protein